MDQKEMQKNDEETERTAYWRKLISEQDNPDVLRGMLKGIECRRYPSEEKEHYIGLIKQRIDLLPPQQESTVYVNAAVDDLKPAWAGLEWQWL